MRFINVLFKRLLFCGGNLHFNSIFVFAHLLLQWCTLCSGSRKASRFMCYSRLNNFTMSNTENTNLHVH